MKLQCSYRLFFSKALNWQQRQEVNGGGLKPAVLSGLLSDFSPKGFYDCSAVTQRSLHLVQQSHSLTSTLILCITSSTNQKLNCDVNTALLHQNKNSTCRMWRHPSVWHLEPCGSFLQHLWEVLSCSLHTETRTTTFTDLYKKSSLIEINRVQIWI